MEMKTKHNNYIAICSMPDSNQSEITMFHKFCYCLLMLQGVDTMDATQRLDGKTQILYRKNCKSTTFTLELKQNAEQKICCVFNDIHSIT